MKLNPYRLVLLNNDCRRLYKTGFLGFLNFLIFIYNKLNVPVLKKHIVLTIHLYNVKPVFKDWVASFNVSLY